MILLLYRTRSWIAVNRVTYTHSLSKVFTRGNRRGHEVGIPYTVILSVAKDLVRWGLISFAALRMTCWVGKAPDAVALEADFISLYSSICVVPVLLPH